MTRTLPLCLAGAALLLLAACIRAAEPKEDKPVKDLVLDEKANGTTVPATLGQQILIRLRGNPTTGYEWKVAKLEGEAIEQVGEPKYVPDDPKGERAGAGGTFVFTFRAAKAGQAALTLAYARPWEKKKEPAQTFALTVEVKPAAE
jgi:predicted secreted protein